MARELDACQRIERSINKKYRKQLWTPFVAAVKRYQLVREGDRIAVCISGGKDSMLLAKLVQLLRRYSDVPFEARYLVTPFQYHSGGGVESGHHRICWENHPSLAQTSQISHQQ